MDAKLACGDISETRQLIECKIEVLDHVVGNDPLNVAIAHVGTG